MKITIACREIRRYAKATLANHWYYLFCTSCVYILIIGVCIIKPLASCFKQTDIFSIELLLCVLSLVFIFPALQYGYQIYFLNICRGENMTLRNLFDGFRNYIHVTLTYVLMSIYILLWSILLVVPGIIKIFSYALTIYIMKDYGIRYNQAIELSIKMMRGNKWKLFLLCLSFTGWVLFAVLTVFVVGILWVYPYILTSMAKFYLEVKEKYELEQGTI
ncbi:MAG: DUF975 family protein [Marinifilaceae bacterium]